MSKDLERAKKLLHQSDYTCVLSRAEDIYTSTERGVKPLVAWLEEKRFFKGYCAADKVVGKATAYLYVLLGVKAVYAHVISRSALQVLREHNIVTEYGDEVEHIINRKGDGICPFEAAVLDIADPAVAFDEIRRKMREMNIEITFKHEF